MILTISLAAIPQILGLAQTRWRPLLNSVIRPERHGVNPRSLKMATISALTTEVVKGNANFPKIVIRRKYTAHAARDTAGIYSRNVAYQRIFVSKLEHPAFFVGNKSIDSIANSPPTFAVACGESEGDIPNSHCDANTATDWGHCGSKIKRP